MLPWNTNEAAHKAIGSRKIVEFGMIFSIWRREFDGGF